MSKNKKKNRPAITEVKKRRNVDGDNPPIRGGGKRKNRDARKEARKTVAFYNWLKNEKEAASVQKQEAS